MFNLSNRNILILMVMLFIALPSSAMAVNKTVLYDCPDLNNKDKQTIGQLTQGYDGWFFRTSDLKQDFAISNETTNYFKRFNDVLLSRGISLVFVPLPSRAMVAGEYLNDDNPLQSDYDLNQISKSYYSFVEDIKSQGIIVPDLYKNPEIYNIDGKNVLYFKRDVHWLPKGADIVAKFIADELIKTPKYNDLSKISVVSKIFSSKPQTGIIIKELRNLCSSKIANEELFVYKTKQNVENNADSLFGDSDETNPVALVGTSFTALSDFNFSGFIEEHSKLQNANFAIAGGGLFTSIISYLSSTYFQKNIPPVLIWETQSVYGFNKNIANYFRQLIPAVNGECSEEDAIIYNGVDIKAGKAQILLDNIKQKISGKDYFIYLYSNNLGFNKFTLEMEYDDGDGEWFIIDRSDFYNNRGRFFIELSDEIDSNLSRISIDGMDNMNTSLNIRICKSPNLNNIK